MRERSKMERNYPQQPASYYDKSHLDPRHARLTEAEAVTTPSSSGRARPRRSRQKHSPGASPVAASSAAPQRRQQQQQQCANKVETQNLNSNSSDDSDDYIHEGEDEGDVIFAKQSLMPKMMVDRRQRNSCPGKREGEQIESSFVDSDADGGDNGENDGQDKPISASIESLKNELEHAVDLVAHRNAYTPESEQEKKRFLQDMVSCAVDNAVGKRPQSTAADNSVFISASLLPSLKRSLSNVVTNADVSAQGSMQLKVDMFCLVDTLGKLQAKRERREDEDEPDSRQRGRGRRPDGRAGYARERLSVDKGEGNDRTRMDELRDNIKHIFDRKQQQQQLVFASGNKTSITRLARNDSPCESSREGQPARETPSKQAPLNSVTDLALSQHPQSSHKSRKTDTEKLPNRPPPPPKPLQTTSQLGAMSRTTEYHRFRQSFYRLETEKLNRGEEQKRLLATELELLTKLHETKSFSQADLRLEMARKLDELLGKLVLTKAKAEGIFTLARLYEDKQEEESVLIEDATVNQGAFSGKINQISCVLNNALLHLNQAMLPLY